MNNYRSAVFVPEDDRSCVGESGAEVPIESDDDIGPRSEYE